MVLAPFVSSESVAFPSYIGFDLSSKLVRDATARSLHCTADNGKKSVENTYKRRDKKETNAKSSTFVWISSSCSSIAFYKRWIATLTWWFQGPSFLWPQGHRSAACRSRHWTGSERIAWLTSVCWPGADNHTSSAMTGDRRQTQNSFYHVASGKSKPVRWNMFMKLHSHQRTAAFMTQSNNSASVFDYLRSKKHKVRQLQEPLGSSISDRTLTLWEEVKQGWGKMIQLKGKWH